MSRRTLHVWPPSVPCTLPCALPALALYLLGIICLSSPSAGGKAPELIFRVGASVGRDGPCAPLFEQTARGYEYFFKWYASQDPLAVSDSTGRTFLLRFQYTLKAHNCTEAGRQAALSALINGRQPNPAAADPGDPPVHFLLGGNGENALEDAIQADEAARILLHCCTARDSVYNLDLPHVYSIFTPASLYTGAVLRAMAFSGVRRVAVVYTQESALHVQLCNGALRQLPPLAELRPGFGEVIVVNYTAADLQRPTFWDDTAAQVAASGADALIACDEVGRMFQLVRLLRNRGHWLSALWLASQSGVSDFLSSLGGAGEYTLTTVQWLPELPYADQDFGTASTYAANFAAATGLEASYFSAAATATGYVLMNALRRTLQQCDLSALGDSFDADGFVWKPDALSCRGQSRGVQYVNLTGQVMVRHVLNQIHLETFFGPIGFNNLRQNVYHPPVVTQVLDGDLAVVVPLDLAERPLVMPIPWPQQRQAGQDPAWASTTAGIVIITLVCCLGCLCLALLASLLRRWLKPGLSLTMEVEIDPEKVQVDVPPVRNVDGTFEPGEGVYRGTRVKLVVATELLPPPTKAPSPSPPATLTSAPQPGLSAPAQLSAPPTLQRSLTSALQLARGSGDTRELSNMSFVGGCGLRESVTRRPPESFSEHSSAPMRSASGLQGSISKRLRKQVSVLVWRALRLQHPHVCPVLGIAWEWPGLLDGGGTVPVIVRQWYELGDLAMLIENETVPLPLLTKANIAQGIAEGLAYLHAQDPPITAGPLHANRILIDKHFNPHIFVRLRNLDPASSLVVGGGTAGLPASMAIRGPSRLGPSSVLRISNGTMPTQGSPLPRPSPGLNRVVRQQYTVVVDTDPPGPEEVTLGVEADLTSTSFARNAAFIESLFVGATPADPSLPYSRSKAQDILEFGRLLCTLFVTPFGTSRESGSSQQPSRETHDHLAAAAAGTSGAGVVGGGGGSGNLRKQALSGVGSDAVAQGEAFTRCSWPGDEEQQQQQQQRQQQQRQQQRQQKDDAAMLEALEEICPDLAELVRGCLKQDPSERPSFSAVAAFLDMCVKLALSGGRGLAAVSRSRLGRGWSPGAGLAGHTTRASTDGHRNQHPQQLQQQQSGSGAGGPEAAAAVTGENRPVVVVVEPQGSDGCRRRSLALARAGALALGLGSVTGRSDSLRAGQVVTAPADCPAMRRRIVAPDDLLFDIFPPKVAQALLTGETVQPERYECVSIFFSDVVGYTDLCAQLQPHEVMDLMHRLYSEFDALIRSLRLFKVETVGDAYLAVGNLRWPLPDSHARRIAEFAFRAVRAANSLPIHPERPELGCVRIRVGLHCGPVVGSVVGTLNRRYCLFGDAVNTAARMEHNSEADRVHCSAAFAALVLEQWPELQLVSRGVRQIKGKGPMETFWVGGAALSALRDVDSVELCLATVGVGLDARPPSAGRSSARPRSSVDTGRASSIGGVDGRTSSGMRLPWLGRDRAGRRSREAA